jgi:serine protease Do
MVKQVMDDLVAYGKVVRSWIGVQIQALDESKAKALGLDSRNGALVADVVGDGPADKAGIETGDVIVEFNSQKVKTVDNLRNKVSASKPNKSYELLLIRDGKKKSMRVKLEEMPSDEVLIGSNVEESSNEIGIKVSSISRSLRNQYDLNAKDEGVVVVSVDENSPSDVAGIQPGDIITRVGTKKCTNPEQFQRLLNDTKKRNMVMLHLKRDGAARYLTLEVD